MVRQYQAISAFDAHVRGTGQARHFEPGQTLWWKSEQPGDSVLIEVDNVEFRIKRSTLERCCRLCEEARKEDWRKTAFLLLDNNFAEYPHLQAALNPNGDYEVHCSKCGLLETYTGEGPVVEALAFALDVVSRHAHST
jgi:hypothetical protein